MNYYNHSIALTDAEEKKVQKLKKEKVKLIEIVRAGIAHYEKLK